METDRMKLREALKANAAAKGKITEVYIDSNMITDPDVLQMTIEEVKHCYGEDVPIRVVKGAGNFRYPD